MGSPVQVKGQGQGMPSRISAHLNPILLDQKNFHPSCNSLPESLGQHGPDAGGVLKSHGDFAMVDSVETVGLGPASVKR